MSYEIPETETWPPADPGTGGGGGMAGESLRVPEGINGEGGDEGWVSLVGRDLRKKPPNPI